MWIVQIIIAGLFIIGLILLVNKFTKGYDTKRNKADPKARLEELEQLLADAKETLTEAEVEVLEQERQALKELAESKDLKKEVEKKKGLF